MKKILITGADSYIGVSFDNYISQWSERYQVETIDMIDGSWHDKCFVGYDTVCHVAGIAHIKETTDNAHLYYNINRDLAIETAKKAKQEGVKQFIFLSSMNIYGLDTGIITKNTIPNPKSNYGKSKLQAEEGIRKIETNSFKVVAIRPPMVYGKGCKGNFQTLVMLVRKLPVFPSCQNIRSVIYIDNLCAFIKLVIDYELNGIFFPQNKEYMHTSYVARLIAEAMGKKIKICKLIGTFFVILRPFLRVVKKAFGSLIYKDTEQFEYSYCIVDLVESVKESI